MKPRKDVKADLLFHKAERDREAFTSGPYGDTVLMLSKIDNACGFPF